MDPRFLFMWPNAQIAIEPVDQMIEKVLQVDYTDIYSVYSERKFYGSGDC